MNDDAEQLGSHRDVLRLPEPRMTPWADGDMPHAESVDLNEYPVELLKLKRCRSFRADLRHKLTIIIRAHGGYGKRGFGNAAKALGVRRLTLNRWYNWRRSPGSLFTLNRIDNLYATSLEKLVAEKLKKNPHLRK